MTPRERQKVRASLQQLRARLLATDPARIEPNRRDPSTSGVADEDAQALSEMLQVLASQRNRGQADLLARIDRALRKIAEQPEEYGVCEECEEPIADRRLDLMPYTLLCAACQGRKEPRQAATRRKLTDYR